MSDHRPGEGHPVLRGVALWAVAAGVIVLAAAAFVLSYPGIHAVARHAGVSQPLARFYPVIFDAMLVIACAAVLSLRGAGLISRCYAWLSLLVLLAAAAGADTLHSTATRLPHRQAEAAAAIIPWALLLIGFSLLLVMLRHARLRRSAPVMAAPPAPPALAHADPQQGPLPELPPAAADDPVAGPKEVILAAPPADQPVQTAPFHRMWSTPTPPDDET